MVFPKALYQKRIYILIFFSLLATGCHRDRIFLIFLLRNTSKSNVTLNTTQKICSLNLVGCTLVYLIILPNQHKTLLKMLVSHNLSSALCIYIYAKNTSLDVYLYSLYSFYLVCEGNKILLNSHNCLQFYSYSVKQIPMWPSYYSLNYFSHTCIPLTTDNNLNKEFKTAILLFLQCCFSSE